MTLETGLPITFHQDEDDNPFTAMRAAEKHIKNRGWSVGPSQRGAPRVVMFGDFWVIAKWRNISTTDRMGSDAFLFGDGRYGPLTLSASLPEIYQL